MVLNSCRGFNCQRCRHLLCENCIRVYSSFVVVPFSDSKRIGEAHFDIKSCMFCTDFSNMENIGPKKYSYKIHPSESPRQSPEPPSPTFPLTPSRSDEDETVETSKLFFSSYCNYNSDIDSSSVSERNEFYSYKSFGSSPLDSPSRIHITSNRVGHSVLKLLDRGTYDQSIHHDDPHGNSYNPLDFGNNALIWIPPPSVEGGGGDSNFFVYNDEDDEIGESSAVFSSSNCFSSDGRECEEREKEPVRAVVHGHFRALVAQLLQGECIEVGKESGAEDWLDIVTKIAWQAATFVKPDTNRGGSMDPGDYVQVKCIASGCPIESKLVKGVVCTKNIKHKRMTSQYKNPRLLVLGGSLEYQRVTNQLASFDTLLQQVLSPSLRFHRRGCVCTSQV